ncbi:enoyl-CoA hydratase/isomerase family protein [Gordonia polyisoprenivorans]|uniref:enoyl-CoA hydratase/isomerase family protein n=1 Tax=Gordonia polyisoprenivorans TaxID=84595 RepID=UPI000370A5E4|nr:enoyl-CoA hydratase-related protein [Gordonia polyisoprenivorans]QUD85920.1 enoyl-CoA hydratase/isomerase family protein [Gordonia polyisoprenivorans]
MTAVITQTEGAVAVIAIDRSEVRNTLSVEVQQGLYDGLLAVRVNPDVRCVIITGTGDVFCAGADIAALDDLRASPPTGDRSLARQFWTELSDYPKPVIAAVEGFALGGGCELALACDIVIAGATARFGVPEVKLGVIPGAGGTQRLIRTVGKATAMSMLLTGEPISAADALRSGIVAQIVPAGEALDGARVTAGRIAANSPLAVSLAKDAALQSFESVLQLGLTYERRNFNIALVSADCHEGQAAFLAKRPAVFTGK